MFRKDKVSTEHAARDDSSSKPTPPTSPISAATITPGSSEKEMNSGSLPRGLGSFKLLGRRSKEIPTLPATSTVTASVSLEQNSNNAALVAKAEGSSDGLVPPSLAASAKESGRVSPASMKYGVLLHPVPEEDTEVVVSVH